MSEIDKAIDEYTEKAAASLETYAAIAKRAGARVSSADPQPTETWIDDAITFWTTAGQDLANLATMQQKMVSAAAKK